MRSLKMNLLITFLLITIIPLIILGIVNFNRTTVAFTQSIQESLLTIVETKNALLEQYIEETEGIGQAISDMDVMQQYLALANDPAQQGTPEFEALRVQVDNILYSFQEANWGKYHHIFLIDQSRKIAISPNHGAEEKGSPSSHLGEDTSTNSWAMQALTEGTTAVSDYSSWVESDHNHQMLFFPLKDASLTTKAVLGFELQIPYEQRLLEENFQLGETGRVFLATTNGVPIVYQGIENQQPLNTPGISEVKRLGKSSDRRSNAQGVDVIDVYLKNPQYPWILIAEIEAQEAFRDVSSIQTTLILGVLFTLVIVGLISIILSNSIVNPIIRLTKEMETISLGNMNVKIRGLRRKDEVGKLAQAFNRMLVSLKMMMNQYQK